MKPPRPDIAIPPLPHGVAWVGPVRPPALGDPPRIERLTARGPLLVHFVDVADPHSARTLPYLTAWHERYADRSLSLIAVNSPRFPFTGEAPKLAAALERLRLPFAVASDRDYAIWQAYGCRGWPSLFLWAPGGVLHWYHFGEGEYRATEEQIQMLLAPPGGEALPEPLAPVRPADAPGARVIPPTDEVFPGGSASEPWVAAKGADSLVLDYEGAGATASVDGASSGAGAIAVSEDSAPEREIAVSAPGLYELASHERHGRHRLELRASPGVAVYCVSFAPGVSG